MKLLDIVQAYQNIPVFSVLDLEKMAPGFERENLLNWQKKGILVRFRNGWYGLSGKVRSEAELYFVANKIYRPSYISLESAMAYYGWIPEAVFTVTSITTRKTNAFDTPVGMLRYRNLKPSLFFGYKVESMNGLRIKIAEPEKALLDFLYLRPDLRDIEAFEGLRLNLTTIKKQLDMGKLAVYTALFDAPTLSQKMEFIHTLLEDA